MILHVATNPSYDILIERGSLKKASSFFGQQKKAFILTDDGVPTEYVKSVAEQFAGAYVHIIPHGESSKNISNFAQIQSLLANNHFSRKDCLIAIGGGVVGDLGGFVASTYMRGIAFYNIPTTLLSMVDSSIGGKTAIDLDGVKNIVGTFYQPRAVLIDPDVLTTLDKRQFMAGLAESIKMAATNDVEFFSFIEDSTNIEEDIESIIVSSLEIKSAIVEADTKESGLRKMLNFGHTFGHAIESHSNGKYLHGEAVAIGMVLMSDDEARERLVALLHKYDLPTACGYSISNLIPFMENDKKGDGDSVDAVFVSRIGHGQIKTVPLTELYGRLG